ncbi:uroporphyrinogen-III synthase [Microbacterium bovistercoris]|uniref:Uroporphyrinogen-III synthase n=1 Tax=Microbacterium bovistercoris TaxID=2293570 RepID=A0A371NT73_9MICO|nr:uroporphyrinogen-III synthase [Microbacterium bovistercoris]REJ05456.1 uroporphyrinogen-III synthase [Microbacterium bovistercoris]
MTGTPPVEDTLAGCAIIIAADRRSADLAAALERRGAVVQRAPAMSIVPHADDAELLRRTRGLIERPPDVVVVTTGVGFRGWMDAAHEHGLDEQLTEALRGAQFVARGPKAHGAIQQAGFRADWVAESETAAEVGEYLLASGVAGRSVVVQHHGAGSDGLDELLADAGADVRSIVVYRWGPAPDPEIVRRSVQQAASGEADAVLFTSAPGSGSWLGFAEQQGLLEAIRRRAASGRLLLAAVGPVTAAPLYEADLATTVAHRGRLGALARTAIAHFGGGRAPATRTRAGRVEVRSRGVLLDDCYIALSRTGVVLLEALSDAGGRVLSRAELGSLLPGGERNPHAVEVAVARVREAVGPAELIQTVVKRGYRITAED